MIASLIGSTVDASATVCSSEKGAGYPRAWRQIVGKQCWYKGKPGMNKRQRQWADSMTVQPAARSTMPTWKLILLLNFGTPQQTEIVLLERVTWEQCIARGFAEIRRRALVIPTGVRCESGDIGA